MKVFISLKGRTMCSYNSPKQNAISVLITKGLKYINAISQYTCHLTTGQMVPASTQSPEWKKNEIQSAK